MNFRGFPAQRPEAESTGQVLELCNVAIGYGAKPVVSDASFSVDKGEFITLLGPSGSGKTSLLRTIAGFVPTIAGEIKLHGAPMTNVPPYMRDIGLVFQNYALFPHMTVAANLGFGPRMMRVPKAEIDARIAESLAQVRLREYGERYPHELSGGQQQRVAIARALAMRPSLLLLDEPMSNLDARLRAQMRIELITLLKDLGVTAVSVTHSQEEALAMSDRMIVMCEGGIRQIGTPSDIYLKPADPFVANFVGDANIVQATCIQSSANEIHFQTSWGQTIPAPPGPHRVASTAYLLIRPESIWVSRGGSPPCLHGDDVTTAVGIVVNRSYMGSYLELRIRVGEYELMSKQPCEDGACDVVVGDQAALHWRCDAVQVIRQ